MILKNKKAYTPSATTSFTSGTRRVRRFSIPAFRVMVEDGQPEQEPCNNTFTVPSSNEWKLIAPPSDSTAGLTYSSKTALILMTVSGSAVA